MTARLNMCFLASCLLPLVSGIQPLVKGAKTLPSINVSMRSTGSSKFVFAHHIIGNTFNFTASTWSADVSLAHSSGIDGFALDIGKDPSESGQVQSAYDAAQSSNTGFKMFLSLDMSSLPCATPDDASVLISLVRVQASHTSQFRFGPDNKALISTFSGESCTFSAASPSEGWATHFIAPLASEIFFVPSFFVDPAQFSTGDVQGQGGFGGIIDGDFNWNSGWPIQLTTSALQQAASNPTALASLLNLNTSVPSTSIAALSSAFQSPTSITDAARDALAGAVGAFTSDQQHLNAIKGGNAANSASKTYMAAVSPWFFTHFSPHTFNKNFIFVADHHLYPRRWETLLSNRGAVDLVEISTWNDFGESHYLGPIEGMQPNSQAWVNGNSHTGWLELTAYYAEAFKTGVKPAIQSDKVIMWARPHPRDAQASQDTVARPTNFELTQDMLWATVMVPPASTVTLATSLGSGSPSLTNSSTSQTFQVPAGVSHLKVPLTLGGSMRATVIRGGQTVLDFAPGGYTFNASPETFNYNAFVAASP